MKKLVFSLAFLLIALGAWATYQKSSLATTQYLFLISDVTLTTVHQFNVALTTIEPDGTIHTEELPGDIIPEVAKKDVEASITTENIAFDYALRRRRYSRNILLKRELLKIKELNSKGWTLTATVPDQAGVRYIFQKPAL